MMTLNLRVMITQRMMTLMKLLPILPLLVNRLQLDKYVEYVVAVRGHYVRVDGIRYGLSYKTVGY